MTLAELYLGVLAASAPDARAARLETLVFAERSCEPIPVSAAVARRFAELVALLRAEGRGAPIVDALIAATAIAHGLVLYSHDADFGTFPGLEHVLLTGG